MNSHDGSAGSRSGSLSRSRLRAGSRLAQLDELVVVVEKLVAGGEGLARFEGIPIFVPRSAPGDRLRVRLVERRPDYGRAEILEVIEPGAGRRLPPCPHFGSCGGCDLQHLEDELQVTLKVAAVRETLRRLGGLKHEIAVEVVAGEPWAYRLRTQVQTLGRGDALKVGYLARRSRRLVAVESCPVLVPELEDRLRSLAAELPVDPPRRIDLLAGDNGALTTAPVTAALPHGGITISVGEFTYELDARCFFQVHRSLLPSLVERVVGEWTGELAVDLYAGVGLFSLPLARRYGRVTAVEGDRVSGRYARRNAQRHGLERLELVASAVESWIPQLPRNPDRVVVDPPRAGLGPRVRSILRARRPKRLTYVSCHAATLARDLGELTDIYRIERLTLLDMFPQTGHMEVVAQLIN